MNHARMYRVCSILLASLLQTDGTLALAQLPAIVDILQQRGLTRREAVAVQERHRRRQGERLVHDELSATWATAERTLRYD